MPATTGVTDAGLEHLPRLTQLRTLVLDGAQVTDLGLERLTRLTKLKVLGLTGTQVTDAGLQHLGGLPKLETLIIENKLYPWPSHARTSGTYHTLRPTTR